MKLYNTPKMDLVYLADEDIVRTSLTLGGNNGEGNVSDMDGLDFSKW